MLIIYEIMATICLKLMRHMRIRSLREYYYHRHCYYAHAWHELHAHLYRYN